MIEAARIAAAKLRLPVKLIVVDTLSLAMAGGNENAPEDMTAFVGNIDRIRQEISAHVAVVHHSGKDAARGARGHNSLRAATDTEIEVSRDLASRTSVAKVKKQRDLDGEGEFPFRLESVTLGTNRRGKPVTSCVVREADAPVVETNLSKDEQTALAILFDLIADQGRTDFPGMPVGIKTVPVEWWRERFYERGRPGDKPDTKKKAFNRGRNGLIASERVTAQGDRVWFNDGTYRDKTGQIGKCPAPSLPGQDGTGVLRPVPCPA